MTQIQAANPVSRALFNTAYRYKQAALRQGDLSGGRLGPFWDRLVFSKIKARVGGEPFRLGPPACCFITSSNLVHVLRRCISLAAVLPAGGAWAELALCACMCVCAMLGRVVVQL